MIEATNPSALLDRRRWLKRFVVGTAVSLGGPAWIGRALAEIEAGFPEKAVLRLKISDYPALAAPGGSIQLLFNQIYKPLTLNRVSEDQFVTLDSICKHSGCTVGRFVAENNQMRCPCHGSRYDIEGRVFRDADGNSTEPAPSDLNRFETTFQSGVVSITLPGIALGMKSIHVHDRTEQIVRLKLVFPVTGFSVYEIRYQPDLTATFSPVKFSKTAEGPADQTVAAPEIDGFFTAYVDSTGPRGFFVVGLRLTAV